MLTLYVPIGITSYLVGNQRRRGSPKRHAASFCKVLSRRKIIHIKHYFVHICVATQMLIHIPDRQCEHVSKHCHRQETVSTELTSPSCFTLITLFSNDLRQPVELKQNAPDIKAEHSLFGALHRVRDGKA
jgi:hypothetical protein